MQTPNRSTSAGSSGLRWILALSSTRTLRGPGYGLQSGNYKKISYEWGEGQKNLQQWTPSNGGMRPSSTNPQQMYPRKIHQQKEFQQSMCVGHAQMVEICELESLSWTSHNISQPYVCLWKLHRWNPTPRENIGPCESARKALFRSRAIHCRRFRLTPERISSSWIVV